jgi:hypothetical protein
MSYDSQTSTSLINKLRKDVDSLTLKIAVLQDVKNNNVAGGTAVTAVWTARTLNTISSDPNSLIIELASNEWKVAAGNYQVKVLAPFHHTNGTRLRIYDVTNSVVIGYGPSLYINNGVDMEVSLNLRITPHKDTVYRLEYYCERGGHADGLGIAANVGQPEIYTTLEITRLDTGMTKPQGGSGVQGPQGPAGPAGPAGPPGPAGSGTVTSVSVVTANGVSGSVADPTTTPAITLTLGAITPSSVAASGAISAGATVTGSNLSGVNTGDQVIILGGDRMLTEGGDFLITESSDYILETGDVTGSGTGRITTTITPQAVTYDKMQWVSATDRVLGRQSANPGVIEEIVCTAAGRALLDDNSAADQRATLGAVPVGPITTSGLTVGANNRLLGRVNSAGAVEEISLGTGISVAGSVLSLGAITPTSVAASGTVTGSNLSGTSSGSNTGDQTITLTGPVTGSGTGSFATTITNGAVTYDKIQTAAAIKRLLGSDATGTSIGEINLGANLSMTGNTLASSNPGGTVTSVSVTTANGVSGTVANATTTPAISLALGAITPTSVAASGAVTGSNLSGTHTGTSSGSNTGDQTITLTGDVTGSGTGSFAATIGNNTVTYGKIQAVTASAKLLGSSATGTAVTEITLGTNLSMTGSTLNATAGGGTVTSVGVSGGSTGLTTSGGPVTTSGTITLDGVLSVANGGTSSTSASSAISFLAGATTNGQYLRGNGTIVQMSAIQAADLPLISLTSGVSGTLGIASGGTGLTTIGSQYQVLTSNGTSAVWSTVDLNNGTSNVLPVNKGGTGQTSYTNGQLLIGNTTGNTLNKATITGTGIITVTNGPGTITISATGAGSGDVVGPVSATLYELPRFSSTTGKAIDGASWFANGGDLYGVAGATNMQYGFVWIPSDAGAPTAAPGQTGTLTDRVPLYWDATNKRMYVYDPVDGWTFRTFDNN